MFYHINTMLYKGSLFKNRKFERNLLQKFGFKKEGEYFCYNTNILDNSFELIIKINSKGEIDTKLIEQTSKDEYSLIYIKSAQGEYIGKVKSEFEKVLTEIKDNCTILNVFKSEYAYKIIDYILEKYKDEPEYLWEKFPANAVFRKKDNSKTTGKWYCAILTAKKESIGLKGSGEIEVIDLKLNPSEIEKIVDNKRFFKAYHMNKKHWFTICLDKSVDIKEIKKYIDKSYKTIL